MVTGGVLTGGTLTGGIFTGGTVTGGALPGGSEGVSTDGVSLGSEETGPVPPAGGVLPLPDGCVEVPPPVPGSVPGRGIGETGAAGAPPAVRRGTGTTRT